MSKPIMLILTNINTLATNFIEKFNLEASAKDGYEDVRVINLKQGTINIHLSTVEEPDRFRPIYIKIRSRSDRSTIKIYDFAHNPRLKYMAYNYLFAIVVYCLYNTLSMRKVADITRSRFNTGDFKLRSDEFRACTISRAMRRMESVKAYCDVHPEMTDCGLHGIRFLETMEDILRSEEESGQTECLDLAAYSSITEPAPITKIARPTESIAIRRKVLLEWFVSIGLVTTEMIRDRNDSVHIADCAANQCDNDRLIHKSTDMRNAVANITPHGIYAETFIAVFYTVASSFYLAYGRWIL